MTTPILETGTRAVFHIILMFSVFMLFTGHNAPGGGFIGGLIAAAAIVLRSLSDGAEDVHRLLRVPAEALLGLGVLCATGAGLAGFVMERSFLGAEMLVLHPPVLGDVHISSVLVFDIGVFLVVLGLGMVIVRTLLGDADADRADQRVGGTRP